MATIRYIAIMAKDPEKLADFYKRYLAMKEIARTDDGDVSLTDSFYNLTLLRSHGGGDEPAEPGFHHLGFQVESLKEVEARYKSLYPSGEVFKEQGGPHRGELRKTCRSTRAGKSMSIYGNEAGTEVERSDQVLRRDLSCKVTEDSRSFSLCKRMEA